MSFSGDADSLLLRTGLNTQHVLNTVLMKDWKTRIFIPQQVTSIAGLSLTSGLQSLLTGNTLTSGNFSESLTSPVTDTLGNLANFVINSPFLILGVSKIRFQNEHVIPTTKGIGSTGEILHMLGTRNEKIDITFTTNKYPSLFGMFLREVIQRTLERASVVYIFDEMVGIIPCVLKSYDIGKDAELQGAIQGTLSFITMRQKGLSEAKNVTQYMKTLYGKSKTALGSIKTSLPLGDAWLVPLVASIGGAIGLGSLLSVSNENTSYRSPPL